MLLCCEVKVNSGITWMCAALCGSLKSNNLLQKIDRNKKPGAFISLN